MVGRNIQCFKTACFICCFVIAMVSIAYAKSHKKSSKLFANQLKNIEYYIFNAGDKVKLNNGTARVGPFETGDYLKGWIEKMAFGDLNNDGTVDAAVILVNNNEISSHFFYDLGVVTNENSKPKFVTSIDLGDNILIHSLSIKKGEVIIFVTIHGPDGPACCPSVKKAIRYSLSENRLIESGMLATKTHETKMAKIEEENTVKADKLEVYYPLKVGNIWFYKGPFNEAGEPFGTKKVEVIDYSDKYNAYFVEHISKVADLPLLPDKKL